MRFGIGSFAEVVLFMGVSSTVASCTTSFTDAATSVEAAASLQAISFLGLDLRDGRCLQVGDGAVDRRRLPWSTFKIPHFVIALESGASRPDERFDRDVLRFPAADWRSDGWRCRSGRLHE